MTERSLEQDFVKYRETGSVLSLSRVFDECAPELVLIAGHLAPGAADPEDLLQATFVDAIQNADRYDAERPLKPWLIGILLHCGQRERKRGRRTIDVDRLPTRESVAPDTLAEAQEFGERFDEALQGLPTGYRQVLTLRLVHGLGNTEIAHALCCPPSTVTTRVQRGLEMLRRALPASFTLATLIALLSERGLAMVRRDVLQHARQHPIVPTGTSFLGLSRLSPFTKIAAAALVIALATATWILQDGTSTVKTPSPEARTVARQIEPNNTAPATEPVSRAALASPATVADTKPGIATTELNSFITGHVLGADNNPLHGAKIISHRVDTIDRALVAETTRDGSFSFHGSAQQTFWAEFPGFQPSPLRFVPASGGEHHIDLHVRNRGNRLRGQVELPDGSPAAFATILVAIDRRMPRTNRAGVWIMPQPSLVSVCDEAGGFDLDALPPGEHPVIAKLDGYGATLALVNIEADNPQVLSLRLQASAKLRGRLVNVRNEPIANATIKVSQVNGDMLGFDTAIAEVFTRLTRTDADGRYTLDSIPAQHLQVSATHPDYLQSTNEIDFVAGQTQHWDRALSASSFLRGTLHDASGTPLSGWLIATNPTSAGSTPIRHHTRTDAAGAFKLSGLSAAAHEVVLATRPNGSQSIPWVILHKHVPNARELDLRLPYAISDAASISGTVFDDIGKPQAGAEIKVRGTDWPGTVTVLSQPDGTFTLGPLMPGGFEISYGHARFGMTSHGTHYLRAGEARELGSLQFVPKGKVQVGFAPDFDGPVGTVEMYFTQIDGVNGTGTYDCGRDAEIALPAGSYRVHLSGSHILATTQIVRIEANGSETVIIPVQRATTVPFRFDPPPQLGRRWQDSLRISIFDADNKQIYSRVHQVDCIDGFEWVRALAPGDYRIEAESFRGFQSTQAISVLPSAEPKRVTISLQ